MIISSLSYLICSFFNTLVILEYDVLFFRRLLMDHFVLCGPAVILIQQFKIFNVYIVLGQTSIWHDTMILTNKLIDFIIKLQVPIMIPLHSKHKKLQDSNSVLINNIRQSLESKLLDSKANRTLSKIDDILNKKNPKKTINKQNLNKTVSESCIQPKKNIEDQSNLKTEAQLQNNPRLFNDGDKAMREKIIVSVEQLEKYTRKFAEQKLDMNEKLSEMNLELENKEKKITSLEDIIQQMRSDQHRMEDLMEHLKQRHEMEIQGYSDSIKQKQQKTDVLEKEIAKLNGWIKQEMDENKRLIEIIKTKKQSMQDSSYAYRSGNLGCIWTQSVSIRGTNYQKQEFRIYDNTNKTENTNNEHHSSTTKAQSKSPHKNKRIVIKKTTNKSDHHQSNLNSQMNEKIKQLVGSMRDRDIQIQKLMIENRSLKDSIKADVHSEGDRKVFDSFNRNQREILLVNKCRQLQRQIEKLMYKLINAQNQKNIPPPEILVKIHNKKQCDDLPSLHDYDQPEEQEQIFNQSQQFVFMK